jgi:RNA polymerase sigma-70 factor (ECF subfamily)
VSPVEEFERLRPRLFGIAYRLLGSAADAEDIVQDAWLRFSRADRVESPGAFLTTIVTRLSLTALDSARARRETYVGPWLPEPVDTSADPALGAEHAEALSIAVLLLLERLSPAERAAYVLHEAFGYPFRDIATVLETTEANARQLASRARKRITADRGVTVSTADRDQWLAAFAAAAEHGDLAALEATLAADVASHSDGGGVVSAARNIVTGRARVAALLFGLLAKYGSDMQTTPLLVNGEPGVLATRNGVPFAVWTVDIGPEGVRGVYIVLAPAKLRRFGTAGSAATP